jgi:hypothetical protein
MFSEKFGWQPIDTAPIDKDVMLIVTDGHGEPYAIFRPFRLRRPGGSVLAKERRLRSRPCSGGVGCVISNGDPI